MNASPSGCASHARRGGVAAPLLTMVAAAFAASTATSAYAQNTGRVVHLQPYAALTETLTDNYDVSAARQADAVTQLTLGATLVSHQGRTKGQLDAAVDAFAFARHRSDSQGGLRANGKFSAELIERRLQIDLGLNVGRTALSAFGTGVNQSNLANANSAQSYGWLVSPRILGRLGRDVGYTATATWVGSHVTGQSGNRSNSFSAALHVEPDRRARFSWQVDATAAESSQSTNRSISTSRVNGALMLDLSDFDLRLVGRAGLESSNLLSANQRRRTFSGVGLVWAPSPRTRLSADINREAFGTGYALQVDYRTPRTVWHLASLRSVSYGDGLYLPGDPTAAFKLIFAGLTLAEPDPGKRAVQTLELMRQLGFVSGGNGATFLTSAATVADRVEMGLTWRGARDTVVLTVDSNRSRRIDPLATAFDEVSRSGGLRTTNATAGLVHQLTPTSALVFNTTFSNAQAVNGSQQTRQRVFNLQWAATLSSQVSTTLGLRHGNYVLQPMAYSENALTAAVTARY